METIRIFASSLLIATCRASRFFPKRFPKISCLPVVSFHQPLVFVHLVFLLLIKCSFVRLIMVDCSMDTKVKVVSASAIVSNPDSAHSLNFQSTNELIELEITTVIGFITNFCPPLLLCFEITPCHDVLSCINRSCHRPCRHCRRRWHRRRLLGNS